MRRIPTGIVMIGRGRKQVLIQRLVQNAVRRAQRTFHFIEHHALVNQRLAVRRGFNTNPFLGEIQRVNMRKKYRVQIHLQEVVEVLAVLTGKRIRRPVAGREGIHKGIERAPNHQEERIAHRKALRATKHGVLENMGNAGGVFGHGLECHQKDILGIIRRQMQMACAGGAVAILTERGLKGWQGNRTNRFKMGMGRKQRRQDILLKGSRQHNARECLDYGDDSALFQTRQTAHRLDKRSRHATVAHLSKWAA